MSLVSDVDYNAAGQMTKITYGNGVTTDYSYNPQTLRLSQLSTHNSQLTTLQDFSYTFDPLGNVAEIRDAVHTGSQTFQYDDLNRLTSAQGAYGSPTYVYDAIGNLKEKEGVQMTYGEGATGPHAVTSTSSSTVGSSALQLSYDANGNMIKKSPTALSLEPTAQVFSYDAENRLVEVKTAPEETVAITFHPGWNFFALPVIPDNGAVAVLLPSFAQDFEQLARVAPSPEPPAPSQFEHYVGHPKFDDFTTLEYGVGYQVYCKSPTDVTVPFTGKLPTQRMSKSLEAGWHLLPAISTQPSAISQIFGSLDYEQVRAYDTVSGSLTTPTEVQPGQAYWVQVRTASTWTPPLPKDVTTRFTYDGDGGKVKQIAGSATTILLGEVFEKAPTGTTTKYVFAGSLRIAAVAQSPEPSAPSQVRFFHGDHLGSSDVVTDAAGAMVEHTEHTPFGAVAVASSLEPGASSPFGFTGQRQEAASGLVHFPGRTYDPTLGRFLQPDPFIQDPADPQSLNRYSYVRNNPVNLVDPSGYFSFKKFFKNLFRRLVEPDPVRILIPGDGPTREIAIRAVHAGINAAQQGQNPFRAAAIEAAATAAEFATIGASCAIDLCAAGAAVASTVSNAVRNTLSDAWEAAQAVAQDLGVSAGRASDAVAEALASPQAATVGRSMAGTAMSRTIDVLSQYGRPLTAPELAGAAPGGLGLDVGLLKTRGLRGFKGAGRPLAAFLTVNEVVNTYQNPLLNLEQQNQRAGIQVGALGAKMGGAALVGLGASALAAATGIGAPVVFGIQVVGGGLWSGVIDAGKDWLLKRKGLSF